MYSIPTNFQHEHTTRRYGQSRAVLSFPNKAGYAEFLVPPIWTVSHEEEKELRQAEAQRNAEANDVLYIAKLVDVDLELLA
ncbi:Leucine-rich repeat extensin-like protein 3 [Hordeum vulgare]|nr:Leucine-rich repeat extensin-like protein 3 [Hordeum vulgare]